MISVSTLGPSGVGEPGPQQPAGPAGKSVPAAPPAGSSVAAKPSHITTQQLAVLAELQATDRHVRAHEQAHLAAAGPYATSGASYTYTTGPDGQLYAVGGEVGLDVSPDPSDPEKTIQKARVIEAAANAPADPSTQDRQVAAMAAQMEITAEQELATQRQTATSAYGQQDTNQGQPGKLFSLIA